MKLRFKKLGPVSKRPWFKSMRAKIVIYCRRPRTFGGVRKHFKITRFAARRFITDLMRHGLLMYDRTTRSYKNTAR